MKTLSILLCLICTTASAQTFGLGEASPVVVVQVKQAPTFGLGSVRPVRSAIRRAITPPVQVAMPVVSVPTIVQTSEPLPVYQPQFVQAYQVRQPIIRRGRWVTQRTCNNGVCTTRRVWQQ